MTDLEAQVEMYRGMAEEAEAELEEADAKVSSLRRVNESLRDHCEQSFVSPDDSPS